MRLIALVCGHSENKTKGSKLTPTITLNAQKLPMKVKQSTTSLKVSNLAAGDSVASWTSSNKKIVKVSASGKLTAKKAGKATVTITLASGLKKTVQITVQKTAVKTKKITGLPKKLTLKAKQTSQLNPILEPITSQDKIKYTTSNKKVASVSSKGLIKAKKKGKAVITIQCGSKKVKCKVTVK